MHYVLVASNQEEDIPFLEGAFRAQPGNIAVTFLDAGVKLLEFISNSSPRDLPLLIVIDQYLSDIDSFDLLVKLKAGAHSRLIPIAILSGFASEELIREYYRAGANCFYKKPFDSPDWNHMADCLLTLFHNKF